jgi:hydrogenase nickel incorporation protein HypB
MREADLPKELPVVEQILSANDMIAAENRKLLDRYGVLVVNVMASPGAGKTSLILRTIAELQGRLRVGVIEGDVAGRVDADKVAETGSPVVQINTGGGCHLDAPQVQSALERLPLEELDLLFIENVGNLICPTGFALGEHLNVMIAHVPEGDDKPIKYPGMFTVVDALILNKVDLMPYVDFRRDAFQRSRAQTGQRPRGGTGRRLPALCLPAGPRSRAERLGAEPLGRRRDRGRG